MVASEACRAVNSLDTRKDVKEDNSTKIQSTSNGCDILLLKAKDRGDHICMSDSEVKSPNNPSENDICTSRISQVDTTYDHHPRWSLSQCEGISCCVA